MSFFSEKIIKIISWLTLCVSTPAWAGPTLMALSYSQKNQSNLRFEKDETEKMTDRLRDELRRRFGPLVYNKDESKFLVSYFKEDSEVLNDRSHREDLEKAKEAYFNLKLEDARKYLKPLFEKDDQETIVETYLLKGLIDFAEGHVDEAKSSFREAHRLDPQKVLESRYFPPKVVKLFNEIKNEAFSKVFLKVDSNPVGTEVWINGVMVGLAPKNFEIPAGKHWVSLRANHYQTYLEKIEVKEGVALTMKKTLKWIGRFHQSGAPLIEGGSDQDVTFDKMSQLGSQVGAAQVILFSVMNHKKQEVVETRIVDVKLKTAQKPHQYTVPDTMSFEANSSEIAQQVIDQIQESLAIDLKAKPDQYVENRFRGDIVLVGHKRRYFFESPWFWGLVGAAGLGIGLGLALTGGSAASTGTLGITFQ